MKFRLAERQGAARGPADDTSADRMAAAAVTVLRGSCAGALVSGPVSVAASNDHSAARGWLVAALRARGFDVRSSGGSVVRLVGYGEDAPSDTPAVTVAMDAPYALAGSGSPTLLATYGSTRPSMVALAAVLAGAAPAAGRSPVAVRGLPRTACG
jgi:beta-N-acetylhexosaminidase